MANTTRQKFYNAIAQLDDTFVQRKPAIHMLALAYLTEMNSLMVGDPGTAKTALTKCFVSHFTGGRYFGIQLGSFTPIDKIIGPVDVGEYKKGNMKRVLDGRFMRSEFVVLDECFKAPDGILNSLLEGLNEKVVDGEKIPLRSANGATNWPEIKRRSDKTDALFDRFQLRTVVEDVFDEENVVALLEAADNVEAYVPEEKITLKELDKAVVEVTKVKISTAIRKKLHDVRFRMCDMKPGSSEIGKNGVKISARRIAKLQRVLQASAWLDGRDEVTIEDFDVLMFGLWNTQDDLAKVASVLSTIDQTELQAVFKLIERGTQIYSECKRAGFGASKTNAAATEIKEIVGKVKALLDQPVFTKSSREKIAKAMADFREKFKELNRAARAKQA